MHPLHEERFYPILDAYAYAIKKESPHLSHYQAQRYGDERFMDNWRELEEATREDVREEEMDIASRRIDEHERQAIEAERKLATVEGEIKAELARKLNLRKETEFDTEDGEKWAFQDGWNAAIDEMVKLLQP